MRWGGVRWGEGSSPTLHLVPVPLRLFQETVFWLARVDEGKMGLAAVCQGQKAITGVGQRAILDQSLLGLKIFSSVGSKDSVNGL